MSPVRSGQIGESVSTQKQIILWHVTLWNFDTQPVWHGHRGLHLKQTRYHVRRSIRLVYWWDLEYALSPFTLYCICVLTVLWLPTPLSYMCLGGVYISWICLFCWKSRDIQLSWDSVNWLYMNVHVAYLFMGVSLEKYWAVGPRLKTQWQARWAHASC